MYIEYCLVGVVGTSILFVLRCWKDYCLFGVVGTIVCFGVVGTIVVLALLDNLYSWNLQKLPFTGMLEFPEN